MLARLLLKPFLLLTGLFLVVACSIQGELSARPPSSLATQPRVEPSSTAMLRPSAPTGASAEVTSTPTAQATPEPSHWTVGLLDEPAGLLPFSPNARVAAPVSQVIFPPPVLELGYAYTTTGILREVPTLANGGVERRSVRGYLDATGQFTTTATGVPATTEQLVVTFHWNPALRWADGQPVTAHDSVFGYDEARRAPPSPEAEALLASIERYEAVDDVTTRAVLMPGRSDPAYPLVAWPPAPRHLLAHATAADRARYARAPLGYGPYTFGEAGPGSGITLIRNRYWPSQGLREQLRFRFFATAEQLRAAVGGGKVDVASLDRIPSDLYRVLDQDAAKGAAKVTYVRGPVFEHLDFNLADPLFRDLRVRRAIAYAVDRSKLVDTLFGGKTTVLQSWILPDQPEYAGDEQLTLYPYDPARARTLLDAAGFKAAGADGMREASNGKPISLTLLTTDTLPRPEIARRIQADLRAVGLAVRIETLPVDQLYSPTGPLFRRRFQLAEFAWLASAVPNGLPLWSCSAVPSAANGFSGDNFAGWCFDAAETALRTAAGALDQRARSAAYLRQQQLWTQELPSLPLLQRPIAVLQRPGIRGVVPDPLAPITWNVAAWKP